jgi:RecA-family ATPase
MLRRKNCKAARELTTICSYTLEQYLTMLDFDLVNTCFEIRSINLDKKIQVGFFDDISKAIEQIELFDQTANVYVAPNPRKRQEHFEIDNQLNFKSYAGKNVDIAKVRWFLIDLDTIRKCQDKEVMATDEEVKASKKVCDKVVEYLQSKDIDPVIAFSGNGWHLMIKTIDYEIDIQEKFKQLLNFLKNLFHSDDAEIDLKPSDPCRIWKCYNTQAMKGKSTTERPYRYAELKYIPEKLIPIDIIEKFSKELVPTKQNSIKLDMSSYAVFNAVITEFKKANLYIKDEGKGIHSVICPWASTHSGSTGIKQTVVYEPNEHNLKLGLGFCCQHGSHDGAGEKKTKDVLEFFKIDKKEIDRIQDDIKKQEFMNKQIEVLKTNASTIDPNVEGLCVGDKDFACLAETMMVFAPDSCGKTWLLLDMAYGFATGKPFWGGLYTPKKPTKVLYFNTDKPRRTFQNKYILRKFKSLDKIPNLEFQHRTSFMKESIKAGIEPRELNLKVSEELLKKYIEKEKFQVFIIDGLVSAAGAKFDFNNSNPETIFTINRIAEDCECFITFSHHSNKIGRTKTGAKIALEKDDYQGSRQISAQVCNSLSLELKDKESKTIGVSAQKDGTITYFKGFNFRIINSEVNDKPVVTLDFLMIKTDAEIKQEELENRIRQKNLILRTVNDITTKYRDVFWATFDEIKMTLKDQITFKLSDLLDEIVFEGYFKKAESRTKKYQLTDEGKEKIRIG